MRYIFILFSLASISALSQEIKFQGIVLGSDGQPLPSAFVKATPNKRIVADQQGHFVISFKKKLTSTFEISHLGYKTLRYVSAVKKDTLIYFVLESNAEQLSEVVIESKRDLQSDQFETSRLSTYSLDEADVKSIPSLGGEADIMKVIQLLPGVSKGVEGSTDLFVRGGAADQNLVLLDGAPVYNTGHLFGFLSVFNPDVLQRVEYTSGGFPAQTGGRLSSILDVGTKSTMSNRTEVQGNIGLLASRLMIRQPIIKNKLDFWVAARRSYVDQVGKLANVAFPYFFYDVNAKVIYHPSSKDDIEITHYSGADLLNYTSARQDTSRRKFTSNFNIANSSQTLKWNRRITTRNTSSVTLYRTKFNYNISNSFDDSKLLANSAIQDYGGKWMIQLKDYGQISWTAGIESVYHKISPSVISTTGEIAQLFESSSAQAKTSLESSVFLQADINAGKRLLISPGLRYSSAKVADKFYSNPEPRVALRYELSKSLALKGGYSRMVQYLHRVSSSAIAFPTDIWYPVTKNVTPQLSDQVNVALQKVISPQHLFISLEAYYKKMQHLVGYREGTNLFLNNDFESQLIQGRGRAYGVELLVKKEAGRLTGWISYTLSKSQRQFDELNAGNWFYSRYDRTHNGSVVANYKITKRLVASGVFEFISGSRFTPVIGQYAAPEPTRTGITLVPVYAPTNSVRLANTHRLDLSIKYLSRPEKKFQSEWSIGVYNVYNRAMPYGIYIEQSADGSYHYSQPGLFGLLPFISYGFKF